jgi:hypothetical protein
MGILTMVICLMLLGFTKANLLKDFASFDRAYIPALFMTNQGEKESSKKTMLSLKENWKILKDKYYKGNLKDSKWKEDFDNVDQMILKADNIVINEGNLSEAHNSLEGIRTVFMELRKRNNMDYYIDYLTEFHEPMEAIILTAKGKNPENLTDADIEKIQKSLDEALSIWIRFEKAKFNKSIFGFNDKKVKTMRNYIKLEYESLNRLRQFIDTKDKKAIIQSAIDIKPNFVNLFTLFGKPLQ